MTPYLLGLATLPVVAALCYSVARLWRWLCTSPLVIYWLSGRLVPDGGNGRAAYASHIAMSRRLWMIPLPGDCAIAFVVGGGTPDREKRLEVQQAVYRVIGPKPVVVKRVAEEVPE